MNEGIPTVELLESIHTFPGRYTFKAIGANDDHFVGRALDAVKSTLNDDAEPPFSSRCTSSGRHIAVTIEPDVTDAPHVIEIYSRLHQVEGIVMLM